MLNQMTTLVPGTPLGSAVSGKTNLESDIDLAFYLEDKEVKDYF